MAPGPWPPPRLEAEVLNSRGAPSRLEMRRKEAQPPRLRFLGRREPVVPGVHSCQARSWAAGRSKPLSPKKVHPRVL